MTVIIFSMPMSIVLMMFFVFRAMLMSVFFIACDQGNPLADFNCLYLGIAPQSFKEAVQPSFKPRSVV
ncbi:hypothetical protein D3C77_615170 [compost metagenome]